MSVEGGFAVFILSHGRANDVKTVKTLQEHGYTGKWYIVIDNEDDQEAAYRKLYGEKVIQFDKKAVSETFDTMDLSEDRRTIVYARNVCFQLAREKGVRYFLELDDDYKSFEFRWIEDGKLLVKPVMDFDSIVEAMIEFLQSSGAITVAMAQGGDFIGGKDGGSYKKRVLRKAMNSFFCDTERPFTFVGRINEDVNTYVSLGKIGQKIFTVTDVSLTQQTTQKGKGGMSDVYIDMGTYLKSFYTVMIAPSCVKIRQMGDKHKRIHHNIAWDNCVPKIINQQYVKRLQKGKEPNAKRDAPEQPKGSGRE